MSPLKHLHSSQSLTCFWLLSLFCCGITHETTVIESSVGSNVTLPCKLSPEADVSETGFHWTMGNDLEVFMYQEGQYYGHGRTGQDQQFVNRVQHFPDQLKHGDGSIVITNVKMQDNGTYRCCFVAHLKESFVTLVVELIYRDRSGELAGAFPAPVVSIRNSSASEAVLQCEVPGASYKPELEWQDSDGKRLTGDDLQVELRGDLYHPSLTRTVSRTSTRAFLCVAKYPENGHTSKSWTYAPVCGPAKPILKSHPQTVDGVPVVCEVHGVPSKTKLKLQDNSGTIVPAKEPEVIDRGGSYDIILQTTVTKSDYYHCVATQEETGLQTEADTYINLGGPAKPILKSHPQTVDGVPVVCEVHGVPSKTKLKLQDNSGTIVPAKEPEVIDRGGSYDIILQTTVTKSDYYHCVATQEETGLQMEDKTYVSYTGAAPEQTGFSTGAVIGLVGAAVVLTAVITVALTIVIIKRCGKQRNQTGRNTLDNELPLTNMGGPNGA